MRRVDVLVIGNGPRAIAVADHALSLGLSTVIVSAESMADGGVKALHEIYERARLSLDIKSRALRAEGTAYTVELVFISLIIAPEPAVGLQVEVGNSHDSLEDSFYVSSTSQRSDSQCSEKFFTDECMEISTIRNAHIIVRPSGMLNLCSPSVLEYLQASANLKIHTCESNCDTNHNNLHEIYAPVDPLKLARISTITKGKTQATLSICRHTRNRNRMFFKTTASRIYILGVSYPVVQQADEIFRRQVFPCRLYQQMHPKSRMSIEYSPGYRIILYGQQQKALCRSHRMYITIRLQSKGDSEQVSEIYLTQLGVVLGFVLFIPEMADLIAPLTLCCNNNFSIVRLLSCWESVSCVADTKQVHVTELVLAYYRETSNDETVYKALHMSFRHRCIVKITLLFSPILLFTAIIICVVLIF